MKNTKLIVLFSVIAVVAVIIVLNSVVFAVRKVDIYCYNADDDAFRQSVFEAADIKKGQSILFMSEKNPTDRIHEKVITAKVINIERNFPDRVTVNVVKLMPHSYLAYGERYLILDNAGKILDNVDAEGFEAYKYDGKPLIELRLQNQPVGVEIGQLLNTGVTDEMDVYTRLLKSLERIDYRMFDAVAFLDFIDLTEFTNEKVTMESRPSDNLRGTIMEIFGTSNLDKKIRAAVSIFISEDDLYRTEHIITVTDTTQGRRPRPKD